LEIVRRQLAKHILDTGGVQEVRWDKSDIEPADDANH